MTTITEDKPESARTPALSPRPIIVQNVVLETAPPRMTIVCGEHSCLTETRVFRIEPATRIGGFKHCPVCGSANVLVHQSNATDHWDSLAHSYGMSVDVMKQIYDLWEPNKVHRFGDFIAELLAEAKAEAADANAT